jgi:hypothetical protein
MISPFFFWYKIIVLPVIALLDPAFFQAIRDLTVTFVHAGRRLFALFPDRLIAHLHTFQKRIIAITVAISQGNTRR